MKNQLFLRFIIFGAEKVMYRVAQWFPNCVLWLVCLFIVLYKTFVYHLRLGSKILNTSISNVLITGTPKELTITTLWLADNIQVSIHAIIYVNFQNKLPVGTGCLMHIRIRNSITYKNFISMVENMLNEKHKYNDILSQNIKNPGHLYE